MNSNWFYCRYFALFFSVFILVKGIRAQSNGGCSIVIAQEVFDGINYNQNETYIKILDNRIVSIGARNDLQDTSGCKIYSYQESFVMPGMIEGHSHMLLHPYNEVSWNDQVLKESIAERSIRGSLHAQKTLLAGFTSARDLGSEGAGYADVGLKESIEKGVIIGPRLMVAGKAIVTTGSYGPKGFAENVEVPLGAEVADGYDDLIRVVRDQIGKGSDIIKVYADYRWGPHGEAMPTFTLDELKTIVEVAESSGRDVVAHASSKEGMRRATLAGVATIEHGDNGDAEIFKLMAEKKVALCPTIAAGDAILQYRGWKKGQDPEPDRIKGKKKSMEEAISSGVTIVAGGDVGVFPHGENAKELELMVDYGMKPIDVLKSVTSINANVFKLENLGRLKEGYIADIIIVKGNPKENISDLRNILFVMKDGKVYKD